MSFSRVGHNYPCTTIVATYEGAATGSENTNGTGNTVVKSLGTITAEGTYTVDLTDVDGYENLDLSKFYIFTNNKSITFARTGSTAYAYEYSSVVDSYENGILTYTITSTTDNTAFYVSTQSIEVYLVYNSANDNSSSSGGISGVEYYTITSDDVESFELSEGSLHTVSDNVLSSAILSEEFAIYVKASNWAAFDLKLKEAVMVNKLYMTFYVHTDSGTYSASKIEVLGSNDGETYESLYYKDSGLGTADTSLTVAIENISKSYLYYRLRLYTANWCKPTFIQLSGYKFTLVDAVAYDNIKCIAPEYSSEQTYDEGEYVTYKDLLYVCLEDDVTGIFDPTKWERSYLSESIEEEVQEKIEVLDINNISDSYTFEEDFRKVIISMVRGNSTKTSFSFSGSGEVETVITNSAIGSAYYSKYFITNVKQGDKITKSGVVMMTAIK